MKDDIEVTLLIPDDMFKDMGINERSKLAVHPPWSILCAKESSNLTLLNVRRIIVLTTNSSIQWTKANQDIFDYYKEQRLKTDELIYQNEDENGVNVERDLLEIDLEEEIEQQQTEKPTNTILDKQIPKIHSFTKESPVIGCVQRVFLESVTTHEDLFVNSLRKKHSQDEECHNEKVCVKLMLQGQENELIMVQLSLERDEMKSIEYLCKLEGKIMEFHNLIFLKSISYRRDASLKSMVKMFIDCFEDSQQSIKSQTDSQFSVTSGNQICVYGLKKDDTLEKCFKISNASEFGISHIISKPPSEETTIDRTTIDIRLLTIVNKSIIAANETPNNQQEVSPRQDNTLHLKDAVLFAINLAGDLVTISFQSSCFVPKHFVAAIMEGKENDFVPLHLKDVKTKEKNHYIADGFSRLFLLTPPAHQNDNNNKLQAFYMKCSCSFLLLKNLAVPYQLPKLNEHSKEGELVKITGRVCGIDEKTALFWITCTQCGCNELDHVERNYYYCKDCKANVACEIKIQLDVFLYNSSMPNDSILCKLLDDSITELLPMKDMEKENFNGFDFRCILGKKLISKLFFVVSVTRNYGRKRSKLFRLKECSPCTCY
ncbi:uncharacterized protein [Clytia hemisphaerica]|uniref:DUF4503 domain-containing protein n=1 Tax=Clytia hemisphaerica TaxID=252671 RepID=A0A7M5XKI4_9CNID